MHLSTTWKVPPLIHRSLLHVLHMLQTEFNMAGATSSDVLTSSLSQSSDDELEDFDPKQRNGNGGGLVMSKCPCNSTAQPDRLSTASIVMWNPPTTPGSINMLDIPWFHPKLTRHHAEAELRNSEEGVYLLRPRVDAGEVVPDGYSLDVRSAHVVKHFKLNVVRGRIEFGQESFDDTESFIAHFDQCPLIGDETGHLLIFKYPYPRDVDEIHDYQIVTEHFVPDRNRELPGTEPRIHSLVSKEGYLVKLGAVVKSWKTRWFVLKDNELKYFSRPKNKRPIRTIELKQVREVLSCENSQKQNLFSVVCPKRTFFLQAPTRQAKEEWITVLQWRIIFPVSVPNVQKQLQDAGDHISSSGEHDSRTRSSS